MIVLDEHLTKQSLKMAIARWYQGQVRFIKPLRFGTLIKDDVIPTLLRQLKQPTFVTINWSDFWKKQPADRCYYCLRISANEKNPNNSAASNVESQFAYL